MGQNPIQTALGRGSGLPIAKLDIKPKKGDSVAWNLISASGIFPVYPVEDTEGRVKIVKVEDNFVYIQFLSEPKWFKLIRIELKGQPAVPVDVQRFDATKLIEP
jgi:hypothetical protein